MKHFNQTTLVACLALTSVACDGTFTALPLSKSTSSSSAAPEITRFVHNLDFENQEIGERCKPFGASVMEVTIDEATGNKVCANTIVEGKTAYGTWGGILNLPSHLTEGQEIWIRLKTFFPEGFDTNSYGEGGRLKFIRLRTLGTDNANYGYNDWYINNLSMSTPYGFIYEGAAQWYMFGKRPVDNVQLGVWETYELYIRLGTKAGSEGGQALVRGWKNGLPIFETNERVTLKAADGKANSIYIFTYWNGGAPKTQTMYLDDVAVATETPANRDVLGRPFIGM